MSFKEWLEDNSKIIIFDGGMGSEIIKRGIKPGKIPDLLNIEEPEVISDIHKAYYYAGSDMCQTNTFGSCYLNLKNHKLENRMAEIITKSIENIKKACPLKGLIVGDIGPSGEFKPPVGKATFEEWFESYKKQVEFLESGVDLWHIETISDIDEMLAAIKAVKEVSEKPIMSSMTYKKTKRGFFTIMGDSLEKCVNILENEKVDVIGANCTISSSEMIELTRELKMLTTTPISIKPNAGKPRLDEDAKVHYDQSIEEFKKDMKQIIKLGAKIVGGCCGTSPQNILALSEIIKTI
ncbi:MAG: homocysteine S-methyltransferase family protein [Candidatus Hodarchaeota archaeon]